MKMEQLHYLLEIAEVGSLNKAAKNLFITQSALSKVIKLMENELGFSLFMRTSQGLVPTENCRKILKDIPNIIRIYNEWKDFSEKSAVVTLNIFSIFLINHLIIPPLIKQIKKKYFDINIEIHLFEGSTIYDEKTILQTEIQQKHFISFIILPSRIDEYAIDGFRCYNLYQDNYYAYVNVESSLAKQQSFCSKDLKKENIISCVSNTKQEYPTKVFFPEFFQSLPQASICFSNPLDVLTAIHNKQGVGLFSKLYQSSPVFLQYNDIKAIPCQDYDLSYYHYLVMPEKANVVELSFLELAKQWYSHLSAGIE